MRTEPERKTLPGSFHRCFVTNDRDNAAPSEHTFTLWASGKMNAGGFYFQNVFGPFKQAVGAVEERASNR